MTLDRFINIVRTEVAKRFCLKTDAEIDAFFIGMEESAKDNQEALEKRDKMLRDTVAELCEAKRLLKAAVDDFKKINSDILTCKYCRWYSKEIDECTYYPRNLTDEETDIYNNRLEAEAKTIDEISLL